MALVAYSDESDFSDEDNKNDDDSISSSIVSSHKTINGKLANSSQLLTGIDSIIDEDDLQTNSPVNITLSSNESEISERKRTLFPNSTDHININNKNILDFNEVQDIVDDVPTVNTWTLTKNLKNFDKSFQQSLEPIKIKKTKNKLQFILPSLAELQGDNSDDDQDDDSQLSRKKYKPSSNGTGLFAVLPKPKNTTTSLVPNSVSRAQIIKPISKTNKSVYKPGSKTKSPISVKNDDSDGELETVDDEDFFSLKKPEIIEPIVLSSCEVDSISSYSKNNISENESNAMLFKAGTSQEIITESTSSTPLAFESLSDLAVTKIDQDALLRLRGKRNKEIVNVIDINADDALMSRHEWMTRSLSETKPTKSFSKKKDGNPTQLQRRKHQITFLAHQAQEREQDLQNSWGQNRYTKMQTQSKYGF